MRIVTSIIFTLSITLLPYAIKAQTLREESKTSVNTKQFKLDGQDPIVQVPKPLYNAIIDWLGQSPEIPIDEYLLSTDIQKNQINLFLIDLGLKKERNNLKHKGQGLVPKQMNAYVKA